MRASSTRRSRSRRPIPLDQRSVLVETPVVRNRDFIKNRGIRRMRAILGDGLLTGDGDLWLHQRRPMQPASHRERVAAYTETMVAPEGR
jgi:cytochrome P450